jgi:hypothetical protein
MNKAREEVGEKKNDAPVVLVPSDVVLFKLVYEYRLLRRGHLSVLTGRPLKRLHRRLLQLVRAGYLATIKLPQQKHIYGLGRLAVPVLVEEGIADEELLAQRSRIHDLKELFLRHEMMIVDLHVTLSLATRGNALRLVNWREGRELHDSVVVQDHNINKSLPVRPDAFFTLEDSRRAAGGNKAHYFLEADRSTENQSRFRDKIRAYFHYIEGSDRSHHRGAREKPRSDDPRTFARARTEVLLIRFTEEFFDRESVADSRGCASLATRRRSTIPAGTASGRSRESGLTIRKSDSAFSFLPSPVKPTERADGTTRQGFYKLVNDDALLVVVV